MPVNLDNAQFNLFLQFAMRQTNDKAIARRVRQEHYDRFMKSGSFNILSTDPGLHLDGDLALDTLRMQSFFVAPRNAAAGH